jgi:hypothetical protein
MKKLLTLLIFAGTAFALNAQVTDLNLEIWKGDFAVGDIDNDGDMDVIVSGNTQNHGDEDPGDEAGAILINDGVGNFTAQAGNRVITAGNGGNIHFGDIDGDGDLDVIFCGWGTTNTVKAGIALNDGNGVFTLAPAAAYPINPAAKITSCGFADFDLNGRLDYYFFANNAGNCIIYFQQPNGSFTPNSTAIQAFERYGTDDTPLGEPVAYRFNEAEVTIIDFDNDGYPDMWINAADLNQSGLPNKTVRFSYLFKNNGFGKLIQYAGAIVPYLKANGASSWGDIDGDGYPDMLLHGDGGLNSPEESNRMWRFFKNIGGVSLEMKWELELERQGSMGNGSVIVDWDNDGKLDFFSGGWNETLKTQKTELFLGNDPAEFTFTRSELSDTYFQGASEQGLRVADLDGDNKVDLLLNGYCASPLSKRAANYALNQSATASTFPAAPTNLNAVVEDSGGEIMVTFSWTAPASEAAKKGTTYNLALKNITTNKWLYNPMAVMGGEKDGWRKIGGRMGNVFCNTSYELYDLPNGTYEWSVQAINGAYLGGAFATTQTFQITGNESGIDQPDNYKPKVYSQDRKLIVENADAEAQSLKIYAVNGIILASRSFTKTAEIELPAGVYIVELVKADAAPFRTKISVK